VHWDEREYLEEAWEAFLRRIEGEETAEQVLSVTELNEYVRQLVEEDERLRQVWVRGEISRWQVYQSGHAYFTLKDKTSQVTGVVWRERLSYLKEQPKVGETVRVLGRLRVPKGTPQSPRGGEFQIEAFRIVRETALGEWWQRFEALRQKLQVEGLFDQTRKRPLPKFPERIGIITSLDGAALRDILRIVRQRFTGVEVIIFPSLVQGAEAPSSLVRALRLANSEVVERQIGKIDVLIIGRGGGSVEDLWAFNEEIVVREVARSRIPIVSAVGHEVDYTLTDFAADVRAPTPTAAAQMVVPDREECVLWLRQLALRTDRAVTYQLHQAEQELRRLTERRCFADPLSLFSDYRQTLDMLSLRLKNALQHQLTRKGHLLTEYQHRLLTLSPNALVVRWRERMARYADALTAIAQKNLQRFWQRWHLCEAKLRALNPFSVLQRGYALVRHPQTRQVLSRAAQLTEGQLVQVIMADGHLLATVNEVVRRDELDAGSRDDL